jgi:hypothetical protein
VRPAPYSFYEDMFTYISCLQFAKKVIYIPEPTYHYRMNMSSLTNAPKIKTRLQMYEECMLNLEALIEQFGYQENDRFMNSVYCRANFEKGRLLMFFMRYRYILPYLLKYFPKSHSIICITDLRSWATKNALKGNILPFIIFKGVNFLKCRIKKYLIQNAYNHV